MGLSVLLGLASGLSTKDLIASARFGSFGIDFFMSIPKLPKHLTEVNPIFRCLFLLRYWVQCHIYPDVSVHFSLRGIMTDLEITICVVLGIFALLAVAWVMITAIEGPRA